MKSLQPPVVSRAGYNAGFPLWACCHRFYFNNCEDVKSLVEEMVEYDGCIDVDG